MKTILAIALLGSSGLAFGAIGAGEPVASMHSPSPLRPRAIVSKDDVTYAKRLKTLFTGELAPETKSAPKVAPPSKSALETR